MKVSVENVDCMCHVDACPINALRKKIKGDYSMIETDVLVIGGGTRGSSAAKTCSSWWGKSHFTWIKDLKSVLQKDV